MYAPLLSMIRRQRSDRERIPRLGLLVEEVEEIHFKLFHVIKFFSHVSG